VAIRRNTRQRQVVLDELRQLTTHPTAAELHEIARQRLPRLSLGTVYRNLELLARSGQIRKLEGGSGQARFDGCLTRHHHVRCVHCGRVEDARGLPEDPVRVEVRELAGYEIFGYRLELVGSCPDCSGSSGGEDGREG